jgi:hypothetical protein
VTTTDFQSYWHHANEEIQSLESGCHFNQYKAANHDRYLTVLHCTNSHWQQQQGYHLHVGAPGSQFFWKSVWEHIYPQNEGNMSPGVDYN